jgi:hypothetical protein
MLVAGFERLFAGRSDMIVGGDFFWYPVKGQPSTVVAADAMVIVALPQPVDLFSIGSYRQWEHGGHPALAVEVLSPSNTWTEMARKRRFYDEHGVDEYWVFEPRDATFEVWVREAGRLAMAADPTSGWVSPATGVHVRVDGSDLIVHDPDGRRRWLTPAQEAARADSEAARADSEAARADSEAARADELAAQVAVLQARLDSGAS